MKFINLIIFAVAIFLSSVGFSATPSLVLERHLSGGGHFLASAADSNNVWVVESLGNQLQLIHLDLKTNSVTNSALYLKNSWYIVSNLIQYGQMTVDTKNNRLILSSAFSTVSSADPKQDYAGTLAFDLQSGAQLLDHRVSTTFEVGQSGQSPHLLIPELNQLVVLDSANFEDDGPNDDQGSINLYDAKNLNKIKTFSLLGCIPDAREKSLSYKYDTVSKSVQIFFFSGQSTTVGRKNMVVKLCQVDLQSEKSAPLVMTDLGRPFSPVKILGTADNKLFFSVCADSCSEIAAFFAYDFTSGNTQRWQLSNGAGLTHKYLNDDAALVDGKYLVFGNSDRRLGNDNKYFQADLSAKTVTTVFAEASEISWGWLRKQTIYPFSGGFISLNPTGSNKLRIQKFE